MNDERQLLDCISESADMGRDSIRQVLPKAGDGLLADELKRQHREYEQVYNEAGRLVKKWGLPPKQANSVAKANAHITGSLKTMVSDDPTSTIAEMVIQGSTMGITKLTRELRSCEAASGEVRALAEQQVKMQQHNIEQMKRFL